jgi:hypothetical protein
VNAALATAMLATLQRDGVNVYGGVVRNIAAARPSCGDGHGGVPRACGAD